jgi:hypothetical protein
MPDGEHAQRDPVARLKRLTVVDPKRAEQSDVHGPILVRRAAHVNRVDTARIPAWIPPARNLAGMRPLTIIPALLAVLIAACGSANAASTGPADGNAKAQAAGIQPAPACPNPHGGTCLGPLHAGTFTTRTFSPAITYTVPSGWTNGEDLPGNFLLQLSGDARYLGIYQNANAPYTCEEHPDPDVGQSVAEYTRWLRRHPLLHVTTPRPVSIGGLHGVVIDISKAPGTKGKGCTYEGTTGYVPFIVGGRGPAELHHVITDTPGWTARVYLLRYKRGNVTIEVSPEGARLATYLKKVRPILNSLNFARN